MQLSIHRQMWRLAAPIILANIAIPLVGLVDTAIMGHMPDSKYLAAIAVGSLMFSVLYWAMGVAS
jgi:MATE family multidrug resistance protein